MPSPARTARRIDCGMGQNLTRENDSYAVIKE
jgi:hypothetical protein